MKKNVLTFLLISPFLSSCASVVKDKQPIKQEALSSQENANSKTILSIHGRGCFQRGVECNVIKTDDGVVYTVAGKNPPPLYFRSESGPNNDPPPLNSFIEFEGFVDKSEDSFCLQGAILHINSWSLIDMGCISEKPYLTPTPTTPNN
jgi:hypothetical protein